MPFVDTSGLDVIERLPGWHGRYFHSASMTFAHYDFRRGASIHEHFHPEEEVGVVAIVPANVRHSVKALTDGRVIIVDYPRRRDFPDA